MNPRFIARWRVARILIFVLIMLIGLKRRFWNQMALLQKVVLVKAIIKLGGNNFSEFKLLIMSPELDKQICERFIGSYRSPFLSRVLLIVDIFDIYVPYRTGRQNRSN